MVSFMDSFLGYNQIKMHELVEEKKNTFIFNRGYMLQSFAFRIEEYEGNLPTFGQ